MRTFLCVLVAAFAVSAAALGVGNHEKSKRLLAQMTAGKAHNQINMTLSFYRNGQKSNVSTCKIYDTNSFSKNSSCAVLSNEEKDSIKVTITPSRNITFLNKEIPKEINFYICTSRFSNVLRGWRRAYNELKWDRQCRLKGTFPYPALNESATFVYNISKEDPTALWFSRVMVKCQTANNTLDYCHYQNSTYAASPTLYMIDGYTGRSQALVITMAVCSCVGPLILIIFFMKELLVKKNV